MSRGSARRRFLFSLPRLAISDNNEVKKTSVLRRHWKLILACVAITAVVIMFIASFSKGEKQVQVPLAHVYTVDDPQFERAMGVLLGPDIVGGNKFVALQNGDEIFPSMLAAIRGAKRTINFETYIYWQGRIGDEFAKALAERARAGVKVNVLLDWVGSNKMDKDLIKQMGNAGVVVKQYHPLRWYHLDRVNHRTHRKILVVDGQIGFTGGVGIGEEWTGHAQDPEHWRDSHFRVEGPVVQQMQAVFDDNWIKTTGAVLHQEEYFPAPIHAGEGRAQVFASSAAGGNQNMELMYLLAINAAQRSIHLSSAYFIPDRLASDALIAAVRRGVDVQIITPGKHTDEQSVRHASRHRWGPLIEAGAKVYEFQPTMFHCKMMIVDGRFVSVGSTNFDPRSFTLNDESNLNIYDAEFAQAQMKVFEADRANSVRMTLEKWNDRPLHEKLWGQVASWFGPAM
jgi:cardiolipin synthase